jgi:hypothetical protein
MREGNDRCIDNGKKTHADQELPEIIFIPWVMQGLMSYVKVSKQ